MALFYLSALASVCDPTRVAAAPIRLDPIAVQASSSWQGNSPERVADGNASTVWNAGGSARQWIELDLGRTVALSKIRLLTHQVPAGPTTHEIWVGQSPSPDRQRLVGILSGWTADSQWLEHTAGDSADRLGSVRYVRIVTAGSPSWVSWREIEVFQGVEFAGYFRDAFDGVGPGDHPDGYSGETAAAGANLTWIGGLDVRRFASKLERARALGVKAILDLNGLMFEAADKCDGVEPPTPECFYRRRDEDGDGYTSHTLYLGAVPMGFFRGDTRDGQVLTWTGEMDASSVLVVTDTSPSWVAWREIRVFAAPSPAVCGDGVTDPGEECDDGNRSDWDGCSETCQIEEDRDADGVPDGHDWCVNVGGTQDFLAKPAPRLSLKGIESFATTAHYRSFSLSAEVQMLAGFQFSAFDPTAPDGGAERGGVEVVLKKPAGRLMHVVLVDDYAGPGTAGWLKSGSSWIYLDPTGANGGITRMAIADRSAAGPGRVKVTVTGREGELLQPVGVADLPLDAAVALGRTGWSVRQGSCGESKFELGECKPNASGTSITCKKQLG